MAEFVYVPVSEEALVDRDVRGDVRNAHSAAVPVIYSNLSVSATSTGTDHVGRRGHFLDKKGLGLKRLTTRAARPLAAVGAADLLWVSCHGLTGALGVNGRYVAVQVSLKDGTLTDVKFRVNTLAERLRKDGLTTTFRDLRLACCFGAVAGGSNFGKNVPLVEPLGSLCFAQELARALRRLGYRSIQVTGYRGFVVGRAGVFGRAIVHSHSNRELTLAQAARTFNSAGAPITAALH